MEVLPEFLDPHVVLSQNNAMSKSTLLSSLFERLGIDDAERESMLLQKLDEIMPASDDNLLALQMWALLADQTVGNVDYARAGCGWNHPESRSEYRRRTHASFHSNITRERRKEDRKRLVDTLESVVMSDGGGNTNALVSAAVELFAEMSGCRAVGADAPTEEGVLQALRAEGLVPLRALCECAKSRVTMSGASIPSEPYETAVRRLAEAVIRGTWRSLRYDAASGDVRQLAALDDATRECRARNPRARARGRRRRGRETTRGTRACPGRPRRRWTRFYRRWTIISPWCARARRGARATREARGGWGLTARGRVECVDSG